MGCFGDECNKAFFPFSPINLRGGKDCRTFCVRFRNHSNEDRDGTSLSNLLLPVCRKKDGKMYMSISLCLKVH